MSTIRIMRFTRRMQSFDTVYEHCVVREGEMLEKENAKTTPTCLVKSKCLFSHGYSIKYGYSTIARRRYTAQVHSIKACSFKWVIQGRTSSVVPSRRSPGALENHQLLVREWQRKRGGAWVSWYLCMLTEGVLLYNCSSSSSNCGSVVPSVIFSLDLIIVIQEFFLLYFVSVSRRKY